MEWVDICTYLVATYQVSLSIPHRPVVISPKSPTASPRRFAGSNAPETLCGVLETLWGSTAGALRGSVGALGGFHVGGVEGVWTCMDCRVYSIVIEMERMLDILAHPEFVFYR